SRKPALLRTAASWIKRLDQAATARTSVHVYRVKYGDARQIARVLTDMFVGNSSTSLDSADNQLAPGSGSVSSSAADRLSLSPNASGRGGSASRPRWAAPPRGATSAFGPSQQQTTGALPKAGAVDSGSTAGSGQPPMQSVRITPDTANNSLL